MPTKRAASADPTLDLSYLSDAEKRQLVQVLQRDGDLQEAERMRIMRMKSFVRQEDRSAEALLHRSDFNERHCIRCYRRFLLLINPWVCCCLCSLRVCRGRCAERSREFSGSFVCHVCDRNKLCQTGQCRWFYDAVKRKFRNSGSAKVSLTLSRDAHQFAEACQAAANQPSLAIEQMFGGAPATAGAAISQESRDCDDAAAAGSSEDGDDSGLELEGRLADFVVQKVLDDHLVMLEEEAAAEAAAAARRSSPPPPAESLEQPQFFGYRQLPSSLTPRHPQHPQHPQHSASGRMRVAAPAGGLSSPSTAAAVATSDRANQQRQQQKQHIDQHIDDLFAFKSSDSFQQQQQEQQISSTPKLHRRDRQAAKASPPPPPPRADLRLGRFASLCIARGDSCSDDGGSSDDGGGSGESWDKAPPVLTSADASPVPLRFGRIDWGQNERTDPRFCAKPEGAVQAPRGERVTFRAVIDGTEPIEVLWHRLNSGGAYEICASDKYELTSDPDGDRSHSLTVYHAAESDTGAYLVIAVNELRAVMHGFRLQVVDNPQQFKAPAFTEPMSDTRAREGRTARFQCRVAGQPIPRVTFLRDGAPVRADGVKYHVVNMDSRGYELQINDVTKSDDAEYSCLATNAAGSTQCDCQLLVYKLAEDDEALRRIEGEIQQTQASMITAAKDMYRASGKIRQLDANFGRLNQRLSSMERELGAVGAAASYPESGALQRITGHMLQRLADHEASAAEAAESTAESSFDAPVSDWSLTSGGGGDGDVSCGFGGLSTFESVPQTSSSSKIVYEIENVDEQEGGGVGDGDGNEVDADLATTERRIYVAASKSCLLRQKLDELERQIASGDSGALDADSVEKALGNLQLLAARNDADVDSIEATANRLVGSSDAP